MKQIIKVLLIICSCILWADDASTDSFSEIDLLNLSNTDYDESYFYKNANFADSDITNAGKAASGHSVNYVSGNMAIILKDIVSGGSLSKNDNASLRTYFLSCMTDLENGLVDESDMSADGLFKWKVYSLFLKYFWSDDAWKQTSVCFEDECFPYAPTTDQLNAIKLVYEEILQDYNDSIAQLTSSNEVDSEGGDDSDDVTSSDVTSDYIYETVSAADASTEMSLALNLLDLTTQNDNLQDQITTLQDQQAQKEQDLQDARDAAYSFRKC